MTARKQKLLNRPVRHLLRRPLIARLATISPDGYPHIVPIYFMIDHDDIVFGSDDGERKVRNARANRKGAVVIGGQPEDGGGFLIQGDLRVEKDPGKRLERRLAARYADEQEMERLTEEWGGRESVIIRLKPRKVIRVM